MESRSTGWTEDSCRWSRSCGLVEAARLVADRWSRTRRRPGIDWWFLLLMNTCALVLLFTLNPDGNMTN
jgi:hypothetical protein